MALKSVAVTKTIPERMPLDDDTDADIYTVARWAMKDGRPYRSILNAIVEIAEFKSDAERFELVDTDS